MIEKTGNLFDSDAPALGHGVNLAGVMGAGIAKAFAAHWPAMATDYRAACRDGTLKPGGVHTWQAPDGLWIVNMSTQERPGRQAKYLLVDQAARAVAAWAQQAGIAKVALPRIGCGIGGLDWSVVRLTLASVEADGFQFETWTPATLL